MMLINGQKTAMLAAADRGLQYGDGLFETLALSAQGVEFWSRHMARLKQGCQRLGLVCPDEALLWAEVCQLVHCHGEKGVIKITLTRGGGGRGYVPPTQADTTRIVALYPWPAYPPSYANEGIDVCWSAIPLGLNPHLAGIKHLNRLEQVLASEVLKDHAYAEALMLDSRGHVIEGTKSNLFLLKDDQLLSPDLSNCGVAGIVRDVIFLLAKQMGLIVRLEPISKTMLAQADAVFLTNSIIGIWPVKRIESQPYRIGAIIQRLIDIFNKIRRTESIPCR